MNVPRRHHYVPQTYLGRWAAGGERVSVRRRDGAAFVTNIANVAVETGFYDSHDDNGKISVEVEDYLADVEGEAATALRELDRTGRPPPHGHANRTIMARFLAFQFTRTPVQRERTLFPESVARYLNGRDITRELVAAFLAEVHLGFQPAAHEVSAAFDFASIALQGPQLTNELAMQLMFSTVESCQQALDDMHWTVEHDRKRGLITSDSPLVLWRKPTIRDTFEGVGINNAEEVRFPLDPSKVLVLTHRPRPDTLRLTPTQVAHRNADAALACHKVIIGCPSHESMLATIALPSKLPVSRFSSGPIFTRSPNGQRVNTGQQMIHMWTPRR